MDFVTITDHDTIDGCLELLDRHPELEPEIILGEEVTSLYPGSGAELHLSVLGHDERQHREIQRRRRDLLDLIGYLKSERIFYSLNHPIWDAAGRSWSLDRIRELLDLVRDTFPGIETRNGSSFDHQNRFASRLAEEFGKFVIGGSDSHTDQVGYTYTVAPGETKEEFLASIAAGRGRVEGGQLTARYFRREARLLFVHNVRRRRKEAIGGLTERVATAFVDYFQQRLSQLVAQLYLAAQRAVLQKGRWRGVDLWF